MNIYRIDYPYSEKRFVEAESIEAALHLWRQDIRGMSEDTRRMVPESIVQVGIRPVLREGMSTDNDLRAATALPMTERQRVRANDCEHSFMGYLNSKPSGHVCIFCGMQEERDMEGDWKFCGFEAQPGDNDENL